MICKRTRSGLLVLLITFCAVSSDSDVREGKAPKVTIDGDSSRTVLVDTPLELTCKVHAYPEPEIIWEDKDYGLKIPSAVMNSTDNLDEYVNVLKISAQRSTTYQCTAKNRIGQDAQRVEIKIKGKFYFDVLESPKDLRIESKKEGKLVCKIDANPSATISWYKDGKPLSSSSRVEISTDQSVVTLKDMQPDMEGKYKCEARNDRESREFNSNVEIFSVEPARSGAARPDLAVSGALRRLLEIGYRFFFKNSVFTDVLLMLCFM